MPTSIEDLLKFTKGQPLLATELEALRRSISDQANISGPRSFQDVGASVVRGETSLGWIQAVAEGDDIPPYSVFGVADGASSDEQDPLKVQTQRVNQDTSRAHHTLYTNGPFEIKADGDGWIFPITHDRPVRLKFVAITGGTIDWDGLVGYPCGPSYSTQYEATIDSFQLILLTQLDADDYAWVVRGTDEFQVNGNVLRTPDPFTPGDLRDGDVIQVGSFNVGWIANRKFLTGGAGGVPGPGDCDCEPLVRPGLLTDCGQFHEHHEFYEFELPTSISVLAGMSTIPSGGYQLTHDTGCIFESEEFDLACGGSPDTYVFQLNAGGRGIGNSSLSLVRTAGTNCAPITLNYVNLQPFSYLGSTSMVLENFNDEVDGDPPCAVCVRPGVPQLDSQFGCVACIDTEYPKNVDIVVAGVTAGTCVIAVCGGLANRTWQPIPFSTCQLRVQETVLFDCDGSAGATAMSCSVVYGATPAGKILRVTFDVGFGSVITYEKTFASSGWNCMLEYEVDVVSDAMTRCLTWPSSLTVTPK